MVLGFGEGQIGFAAWCVAILGSVGHVEAWRVAFGDGRVGFVLVRADFGIGRGGFGIGHIGFWGVVFGLGWASLGLRRVGLVVLSR